MLFIKQQEFAPAERPSHTQWKKTTLVLASVMIYKKEDKIQVDYIINLFQIQGCVIVTTSIISCHEVFFNANQFSQPAAVLFWCNSWVSVHSYLSHHGLLVLFLLCDLDGRQLGDSRDQEVHQDVLTVGQLVHHALQTSR